MKVPVLRLEGIVVVKIEKPSGDDARRWGPPFIDGASATFQAMSRSKQSWALDLRDEGDWARRLALVDERADVVIRNMRSGQTDASGPGAEALRARKPNLGAFGSPEPLQSRPGYAPLMQAFGGIMSVVGEPGGAPVRVGPSIIDIGTGMWACLGIACAWLQRRSAGAGSTVDVSLFETAVAWMTMHAAQVQASGELPRKTGSGQTGIVPYRAFRAADGDQVVAAGNDSLCRQLCGALGHPDDCAADPLRRLSPAAAQRRAVARRAHAAMTPMNRSQHADAAAGERRAGRPTA